MHLPYKGSGPAIIDLLAGHIVMNFDAMSSVVNYLAQGKMRPLAVTTTSRDPQLPHVPTLREIGLKDYDVRNWYGVMAPAWNDREDANMIENRVKRILREVGLAFGTYVGGIAGNCAHWAWATPIARRRPKRAC